MPEGKRSLFAESFLTLWIVIRVVLILAVWIGLFLALFLGYFTVPIILVLVLTAIYWISDAVFLVASRLQEQANKDRNAMLQESSIRKDIDHPVL